MPWTVPTPFEPLRTQSSDEAVHPSVIWGRTCAVFDWIVKDYMLPEVCDGLRQDWAGKMIIGIVQLFRGSLHSDYTRALSPCPTPFLPSTCTGPKSCAKYSLQPCSPTNLRERRVTTPSTRCAAPHLSVASNSPPPDPIHTYL